MPYGPFQSLAEFETWMNAACLGEDPFFHAVVDRETGKAMGVASFLRIAPPIGVIEVGHINYGPRLQRTAAGAQDAGEEFQEYRLAGTARSDQQHQLRAPKVELGVLQQRRRTDLDREVPRLEDRAGTLLSVRGRQ